MSKPVIVLVADMPLGRLLPHEFNQADHTFIPWIFALFQACTHQNDFDIHWITLSKHVNSPACRTLNNQTLHILPLGRVSINLMTMHVLPSLQIRRLLKSLQPDLVHAWGVEQSYAWACKSFRGQKLLSYQGAMIACCQQVRMKIYPRLQAFWEKRTTPAYRHITGESPWAMEQIAKVNPSARIYHVEYGVEQAFLDGRRQPTATPSCLFVGTLFDLKGVRYLVDAFRHPDMAGIELNIAGTGDLRKELEPLSTPNIHWLGRLSRQQVLEQLEKTWCLIHPTLADTGPTIMKEARVLGLPIITTPNAGSKQYVDDGQSGYIVPVRDAEAIRKAALAVTSSLETNLQMGAYRLAECRAALDISLTIEKFLQLYADLLQETSTSSHPYL